MAFYTQINNHSTFDITFTKDPKNDFGVFAKGYYSAASMLAENLLSRGNFADYDAYPVVFLYRHSLELYLKNVIYKSALLSKFKGLSDTKDRLYNNHKLTQLSEKAAEILRKLFPYDNELQHVIDRILKISSEFSDIDPDSYAYRYPIDRQGGLSTRPHQIVNLEAFHRTMKELLTHLETIDIGINIETDKVQEIYKILEQL